MAKEKSIKTVLRSLYNQLKKHDQQPSTRVSRHAEQNGIDKTIPTRKGKIEKTIKYLESKKK